MLSLKYLFFIYSTSQKNQNIHIGSEKNNFSLTFYDNSKNNYKSISAKNI